MIRTLIMFGGVVFWCFALIVVVSIFMFFLTEDET
jgi:hypothetical protein